MKKLLFCILCCSNVKVSAAEKHCLTVPSCDQRTAIALFHETGDIFGFIIRVGMKKEIIEKAILERLQSKNKRSFILTSTGHQLPKIITSDYLKAHYPDDKNITLEVFLEK